MNGTASFERSQMKAPHRIVHVQSAAHAQPERTTTFRSLRWLFLIMLVAASACRGNAALPTADLTAERFSARGRVVAVRATELDIHHERIASIRTALGKLEPMEPIHRCGTGQMVIKYGQMKTVAVTEFKAKCLTLLDDVARTGDPLVITKHGRALARVVPTSTATSKRPQDSLAGTVTIVGDIVGSISGPGHWNAARGALLSLKRTAKSRRRR